MIERALILGLYSVTPVHVGSGAELSVVDLPIQRERHTGFPVTWGQSLKGVLRGSFRRLELSGKLKINSKSWEDVARKLYGEKADDYIKKVKNGKRDPPLTEIIFGPSTEAASEHAGAISIGDAKVLLFPVRSLKGVFAYVTCPLVLERLKRDLELIGKKLNYNIGLIADRALVSENSSITVDDNVVIEDIVLKAENRDLSQLMSVIGEISPIEIDESRVTIIPNDVFTNLVQTATEIVARVKINAERGTVETRALWYEEYLPSDTLLYSVIAVGKPKREIDGLSTADGLIQELEAFDGKFIQVGGNETVGKGFVKLKVWSVER